jgi:hypothetical protein
MSVCQSVTANTNWKERLSTVDLLAQTFSVLLLYIIDF